VTLLEVDHVSVSFGGVHALTDVDLTVEAGAVTGLIGPNGAGKTTLFNVISGLQTPVNGRVLLDEQDITGMKPYQRARLGVARTFQRLEVFGSLTVRDNVRVSAEILKNWKRDAPDPRHVADEVLDRIDLRAVAEMRADELPTGLARLVELGRALAVQPKLLLLDEPSAGLDDTETDALAALLTELARQGLGVLLVEHDVEFVVKVCALIHVLDFGRMLAVGTPQEVQRSAAVQAAYLGSTGAKAAGTNGAARKARSARAARKGTRAARR
jgi:branched-chain amino acid transport system ATP-binding protein